MEERATLFFVDDDPRAADLFLRFCRDQPYAVQVFRDPVEALDAFVEHGADLIVTDLSMPAMSGIDLLRMVRDHDEDVPVIVITGYSTVDNAIEALRLGATDFIKKPYDVEELLLQIARVLEGVRLKRENRLLKRQLRDERLRYGMVGRAEAMHAVYRIIDKVADIRCNVILEGESGTGKELVARAIHYRSPRWDKPFVVENCAALPEQLLESELFGHKRGSFTGAYEDRVGLFQQADGGTIFLDEIGDTSPGFQVKLLRVLQEGEIRPVGAARPVKIDVRVISATNRDLEDDVRQGHFREDLYYRLSTLSIHLPPLRERPMDIPLVAESLFKDIAQSLGKPLLGFTDAAMRCLREYHWPGNVRQLQNEILRMAALADDGGSLGAELLSPRVLRGGREDEEAELSLLAGLDGSLKERMEKLEAKLVKEVLIRHRWNKSRAAEELGLSRVGLRGKLARYGLEGEDK